MSTPVGAWLPSDPGQLLNGPRELTAADGTKFLDTDVHSFALPRSDGQRLIGVALFNPREMAQREEQLRNVSQIEHYFDHNESVLGTGGHRNGAVQRLPRGLTDAFVVVVHSLGAQAAFPLASTGQNHMVWSQELSSFLKRQMA
ncbi:hypothetical protein AB4Z54_53705, partial [Streptomyces sp. MCAF7]